AEVTKLLVPTPPAVVTPVFVDADGNGEISEDEADDARDIAAQQYASDLRGYREAGWVSGMFKSFGDAPDGFKEELKEFTYALGAEYLYQDAFALRLGYFNEDPSKGARKFFSLGAGFRYTTIKVDVS